MSWNPHMEVHYNNINYPYNTAGSFIEYFEGLTYEHVNFIFSGASHPQESSYPSNSAYYKFGPSDPENTSYYRYNHGYEVNHHEQLVDEYRRPSENSSTINEQTAAVSTEWGEGGNTDTRENSIECPRRQHSNSHDYQVIWQDNIDPDNMTYEELLELGEAVGTQSRGLTQEQISSLPVSKYKCGFFLRKKSRDERLSNQMGLKAAAEAAAEFLNKAVKPVLLGGPKLRVAMACDAFVELADTSGYADAVFTTHHWMVRIYKLKPQKNRIREKIKKANMALKRKLLCWNKHCGS